MHREMTPIQRTIAWLALAGVAAFGCYFVLGHLVTSPSERAFSRKFHSLQNGMKESEVVAILGPPYDRSGVFRLGQPHGYEKEYAAAARSGCKVGKELDTPCLDQTNTVKPMSPNSAPPFDSFNADRTSPSRRTLKA